MNILYIIPYPPSQVRVRPYQLIQALSRRGHHVTIMTVWSGPHERADVEALAARGFRMRAFHNSPVNSMVNSARAILRGEPMQSRFSWHPGLAAEIQKMICGLRWQEEVFDIVHVEHLRGVHYGLAALCTHLAFSNGGPATEIPVVWDSVDCISFLFEQTARQATSVKARTMALMELGPTRKLETYAIRQFHQTLVTSPADRSALHSLVGQGLVSDRISIIPNGVDMDYFQPGLESTRAPETLVVSGKMSYHANVAMVHNLVEKILPIVRREVPNVQLVIAGKDPAPDILKMASQPGITVTGSVPDLAPYLQNAAIAVAPVVYGAGIQNKVLEAMACATPVVASCLAAQAISARSGEHFLVAEDNAAFAQAVVDLLHDPDRRQRLGNAGRAYVEQNHNWDQIAVSLEHVYQNAIHHTLQPA